MNKPKNYWNPNLESNLSNVEKMMRDELERNMVENKKVENFTKTFEERIDFAMTIAIAVVGFSLIVFIFKYMV